MRGNTLNQFCLASIMTRALVWHEQPHLVADGVHPRLYNLRQKVRLRVGVADVSFAANAACVTLAADPAAGRPRGRSGG